MKLDFRRVMLSLATGLLPFVLLISCVLTSQDLDDVIKPPVAVGTQVTFLQNVVEPCCTAGSLLTVVIVCSAVENQLRRDVIRHTWGSLSISGLRIVFLLGRTGNTDSIVASESRLYGDVIQADIVDTYANLTHKSLAALRWTTDHCACAKFIVKADDDVFINTPLLDHDLRSCVHQRFIMGHVIARAQPVRHPDEKWFTPLSVYSAPVYPTYASGAAYVISGDVVRSLLQVAEAGTVPVFWIEDIYITGMLARAAGAQLIVNGKLDGYRTLSDECGIRNHLVLHRISEREMKRLWAVVTQADTQC